MIFTDLYTIKSYLEIDPSNTQEDKKLMLYAEAASQLITEYLGRPVIEYGIYTEYYNGTDSALLPLRIRPVYLTPTIQVYEDDNSGNFGSTSGAFDPNNTALTYGEDFCIVVDQVTGTSRSGILIRINDFWDKIEVRRQGLLSPYIDTDWGNIRVVYAAGYTVDTLPAAFVLAANIIVAKLRALFPQGTPTTSESYEARSMSFQVPQKNVLLDDIVKPLLNGYRNWKW